MASNNIATIVNHAFKTAKQTTSLVTKWGLRAAGAVVAFQLGAVTIHDHITETPEDALRKMGYNPELLTNPPSGKITIRMVDQDSWISKYKLYNRLRTATMQDRRPDISPIVQQYAAAAIPSPPSKWSDFFNNIYQKGPVALTVMKEKETALISMSEPGFLVRYSNLPARDGNIYNVFDPQDSKDMDVFILLHEWDHASKLIKKTDNLFDSVHTKEIEADLYALKIANQLTQKNYTQKLIDFRILATFHEMFSDYAGDGVHNTGLHLHYRNSSKSVSQREAKETRLHILQAYAEMKHKGMAEPDNPNDLLWTALRIRANQDYLDASRSLTKRQKDIMHDTLGLLASAALRLDQKGPLDAPHPKRKFIISNKPPPL